MGWETKPLRSLARKIQTPDSSYLFLSWTDHANDFALRLTPPPGVFIFIRSYLETK
jgi:hypothetical protein